MEPVWRELTHVLARPALWLAVLVFWALFGVQTFAMTSFAQSGTVGIDPARIGLISSGFGFIYFLVRLIARFVLARALGGDEDRTAPATGFYLLYSLGYEFIFSLSGAVLPLVAFGLLGLDPQVFFWLQSGLRLLLMVALLSVAVRLAALAHSGQRLRHREIRAGMQPQWYAASAGLGLVTAGLQMGLTALLPGSSLLSILAGTLIGAGGQAFMFAYVIALYRVLKHNEQPTAQVFA